MQTGEIDMPLRHANSPVFTKQIVFTRGRTPCTIEYYSHNFIYDRVLMPNVRYEGIKFNGLKVTLPEDAQYVQQLVQRLIAKRQQEAARVPHIFRAEVSDKLWRDIVNLQVCEAMAECVSLCSEFDFINNPEDFEDRVVPEAISSVTGRQNT